MPAPASTKRSVLRRYGCGVETWIETGTYFRKTTEWLAERSRRTITVEADASLAARAIAKFKPNPTVEVIHGYSENVLPEILSQLFGSISFSLDGHFSGGVTARGSRDTPIREQLEAIENNLGRLSAVNVFVDDFREFGTIDKGDSEYPSRSFLVDWATRNKLHWSVEHDIFIATTSVHKSRNRLV